MFSAVLFDLDNTLIDFMKMKRASCEAAIDAMIDSGLELDPKTAYKKLFDLYDIYGIENQRIFQKFLRTAIGKIDYKILANGITAYRRAQAGVLEPYPHTRPTLLKLKQMGIKLGIVSDAPRLRAWIRLSETSLTDFFDVVVTLGDTKRLKPHRMPFRAAIRELSIPPEKILFVGDNPERDIKGAKDVGMKTALAKYGQIFKSKKIKSDFVINDVQDLLEIVGQ